MQKTGRVKDKPKKQLLGEQSEVAWDTWDAKIKIKSKKKKPNMRMEDSLYYECQEEKKKNLKIV